MSYDINVMIHADTSKYRQAIADLSGQTDKVKKEVETNIPQKMHMLFGYVMHIGNLIVSNMAKVAKTEEEQLILRGISTGIQVAQTEVAVGYSIYRAMGMGIEASAMLLAPDPTMATKVAAGFMYAKSVAMYGVAGALQAQMFIMLQQQAEQRRVAALMKSIDRYYEMYR